MCILNQNKNSQEHHIAYANVNHICWTTWLLLTSLDMCLQEMLIYATDSHHILIMGPCHFDNTAFMGPLYRGPQVILNYFPQYRS